MLVADAAATLVVPWEIDYASVVVGVLTGALFGCRRRMDVVGTTVLGFLTGFGGGIVRDLLMATGDIYFMTHPRLIWVSLAICLVTFYFRGPLLRLDRSILVADTLSVALFALAGASKAFAYGLDPLYVIIMGTVTAVGGGAIRDSFAGVTPAIFKQSDYYALACVGGSAAFALLAFVGVELWVCGVACVATVAIVRALSLVFGWQTHVEPDLTPRAKALVRRLRRRGR